MRYNLVTKELENIPLTPWGEIGYLVYKRTYARKINNSATETEEFHDTVERVLKACRTQVKCNFTLQEEEDLYQHLMALEGSVAGRFWWQMGTKTVNTLGLASLQNCAGCLVDEPIRPFTWTMDMLMLGCGVGFNIQKEFVYQIPKLQRKKPKIVRVDKASADYIIPDTREGWVKLLGKVLKSYFYSGEGFTYSTQLIRGADAPIKGFGGTASGPEILVEGINLIAGILDARRGKKIRPIDCLDIMNIIGMIVVAGNVRRSALIALGDGDDLEYLRAKRWDLGNIPNWRSNSNNSVVTDDISKLPEEFWEGYKGNGEPYGLINLENARAFGRLGETQYPDPDVVVFNPCFTGDMRLLTDKGYKTFEELSGNTVKVVNSKGNITEGKVWCSGEKEIIEVRLKGRENITCTPDHVFMLNDGTECEAQDLKGKRVMPYFSIKSDFERESFFAGFIQGDGNLTRISSDSHKGLEVNIGTKDGDVAKLLSADVQGRVWYSTEAKEIALKYNMPAEVLPKRAINLESLSTLNELDFLSGLYSANGSVIKGKRVALKSTCKVLIEQVKSLLEKHNISSYITTNKSKAVTFANGEYACKESYDLNITKKDSVITFANKVSFCQKYKQEALSDLIKSTGWFVTKVEVTGNVEKVYDFTEPEVHWGVVEGVVVHNCAEQGLNNFETCCLAELYLPNIKSEESLWSITKLLYRICKHSLALPCHNKETEAIVHANMRMGIGITGDAAATEEQRSWLDKTYEKLREYDLEYSAANGFTPSIKLTTVKPSGTLSLLAGVPSGGHPAFSEFYIRRVRMASSSPLVELCRKAGFPVEYVRRLDKTDDYNTVVVEFPCKYPSDSVFAGDVTAVDQLETVKRLQTTWSDNAVSVTVYYKLEELDEIREWLTNNYTDNVKTVSFLLHSDHGFDQAPLEEITEEEYLKRKATTTPIVNAVFNEDDISSDQIGCESGACPLK